MSLLRSNHRLLINLDILNSWADLCSAVAVEILVLTFLIICSDFVRTVCVQACIAHRRKLESRLFHLQQAYHSLQDEVDFLRQVHGPGSALTSIQGTSDAVLVAAYIGGRVWRRFYGPLGPSIPLDR